MDRVTGPRKLAVLSGGTGAPAAKQRTPLISAARGDATGLSAEQRAARGRWRVALVSMPFQSASSPSIQLGLLRSIAESHGFSTDTLHLCLDFAQRVEFSVYEELCQMRGRMTGDWLFSIDAFRESAPDGDARFVSDFASDVSAQLGAPADQVTSTLARRHRLTLLRIRNEVVPAFLDAIMMEVDWSKYQVVGFSSVFQQTVASVALARRLKEAFPHIRTVFGGSNFEAEMGLELIEKLPWIDHAVLGEGDEAFPELLVALSEQKSDAVIPGVASRVADRVVFGGSRALLENLDQLPLPSYDEYFTRAEATGLLPASRRRTTRLPFESARGCWWGQKHHCTFCGLNNTGMRFRSKSPEVVARELATLARAHGTLSFSAVDNIVELQYLKTLFPHIVTEGKDYRIFYEIKSNLTREQVKALREAGVNAIQPGIESLNTHVLSLMRKGVTAIQNVNLLRWATYYGIYVGWNVLWGFPGERDQDYVEQAQLVRHLTHLRPPSMAGVRILLERFSPLFFDREAFPIEFMRPEVSYSYVYPKAVDLFKVAYFFEYKLRNTLPPEVYVDLHSNLLQWIDAWAAPGGSASHEEGTPGTSGPSGFSPPRLTFAYSDDLVQISDFRRKRPVLRTIEGELARLYKAASDRPTSAARAIETGRLKLSVDALEHAVDEFCDQGIMMRDGSKFLSLALPASPDR